MRKRITIIVHFQTQVKKQLSRRRPLSDPNRTEKKNRYIFKYTHMPVDFDIIHQISELLTKLF